MIGVIFQNLERVVGWCDGAGKHRCNFPKFRRGGWMVQWCWKNFQCRGVLLTWIIVGQGPIALAVDAGGDCLGIFNLFYHFSLLSPSLGDGPM